MKQTTHDWLAKIAALNNTTPEEVLRYINALSHEKPITFHLRLAD